MTQASHGYGKGKGRLLFLLAVCLAISVALLSAIAPLGLPFSRAMGSAFNPATTSVVLKARSPAEAAVTVASEPDDSAPVPLPLTLLPWVLPAALLMLGDRSIAAPLGQGRSTDHRHGFVLASMKRARAPPVRF